MAEITIITCLRMAVELIADRLFLTEIALDVASLPRGDDIK
jgi:hypothetical protein